MFLKACNNIVPSFLYKTVKQYSPCNSTLRLSWLILYCFEYFILQEKRLSILLFISQKIKTAFLLIWNYVLITELILGFFFHCVGAALLGQGLVDFLSSCVIFSLTDFFRCVRTNTVHIIMRCIAFIFGNLWTTTYMAVTFQIFGTISESSGKFLMLETSELYVLYSILFHMLGLHSLSISSQMVTTVKVSQI